MNLIKKLFSFQIVKRETYDAVKRENISLRTVIDRARLKVKDAQNLTDQEIEAITDRAFQRVTRNRSWQAWRRDMESKALERAGEKRVGERED